MAIYCARCGYAVEPDDLFCGNCGATLNGGNATLYVDGAPGAAPFNGVNANPYDAGASFVVEPWEDVGEVTVGPSFWGAFGYCIENYCNFKGRATRMEFWGWTVAHALITNIMFSVMIARDADLPRYALTWGIFALSAIFYLPKWALCARRAHDFGMSAIPFILYYATCLACSVATTTGLAFIPLTFKPVPGIPATWAGCGLFWLGFVVCFILGLIPGSKGANRFGGKRLNPSKAVGR